MYRALRLRNFCVAVVVMCLCLSGSRSSEKGVNRNKHFIHKIEDISPRIIGGEDAPPHTYPFQVALRITINNRGYSCGGTLISTNMVLTAAHCIESKPENITVFLGTHLFMTAEHEKSVVMSTEDYKVHSLYNPNTIENDIALVWLPQKVTFNEYIQPVKLASGSDTYEGKRATIIGWGMTEKRRTSKSDPLKRVNTTIMYHFDCQIQSWIYAMKSMRSTEICTSGAGPIGACSGDSGGPLMVDGIQVGIVSYAPRGCKTGGPSFFTRVSAFSDWIARGHANTFSGQFEAVALIALGCSYFFN